MALVEAWRPACLNLKYVMICKPYVFDDVLQPAIVSVLFKDTVANMTKNFFRQLLNSRSTKLNGQEL